MKTIMIDRRLEVTLNTVPEELFQFMDGVPEENSDGGVTLKIKDGDLDRAVAIMDAYLTENERRFNMTRLSNNITVINPVEERDEEFEDEEDDDDLFEEEAPQVAADRNEGPALGRARNQEAEPRRNFETGINRAPEVSFPDPLTNEAAMQMIAALMENEKTSMAKNLHDMIEQYNREMTKILNLGRKISEATREIEGDPIIGGLLEEAEELRRQNENVEDVYFANNSVIVKTRELVTDGEFDGSRRLIGRMKLTIDLKPVVGKSSQSNRPVQIENLDRVYSGGGTSIYHCGHVLNKSVCLGTIGQEQMLQALEHRDLSSIVEVIIRFIKNPNPGDSWASHITRWPEYR